MAVVGANIFRGGWFAVQIDEDVERPAEAECYPDAVSVMDAWGDASRVLLGMPIGLPDAERPTRRVDQAARRALKPLRHSSVFPVPSRAAIEAFRSGEAKSYQALSDRNHRELGKRLSRQSAALVPKIAELDELMLGDAAARGKIREAHRELCFWGLNGRRPMEHAKSGPEGIAERVRVLSDYLPWAQAFAKDARREFRRQVPAAVVVDSLATALTAVSSHPSLGDLQSLPTEPEMDACGLPMEMVYRLPRSPARRRDGGLVLCADEVRRRSADPQHRRRRPT